MSAPVEMRFKSDQGEDIVVSVSPETGRVEVSGAFHVLVKQSFRLEDGSLTFDDPDDFVALRIDSCMFQRSGTIRVEALRGSKPNWGGMGPSLTVTVPTIETDPNPEKKIRAYARHPGAYGAWDLLGELALHEESSQQKS